MTKSNLIYIQSLLLLIITPQTLFAQSYLLGDSLKPAEFLADQYQGKTQDEVDRLHREILVIKQRKYLGLELESENDAIEAVKRESLMKTAGTNTSEVTGPILPQISVRSDFDDSDAKFSYSTVSDAKGGLGSTNFSLSATVPFDKDIGRGDFLTETGLPNKLGVNFSLNLNLTPISGDDELFETISNNIYRTIGYQILYQQRCAKYVVDEYLASGGINAINSTQTLGQWKNSMNTACEFLTADGARDEKSASKVLKIPVDFVKFLQSDLDSELKEISYEISKRSLHIANFSGSWGIEDFKHRDPLSFAKMKDRKSSYSFAASYGYMPELKKPLFLAFGGEYKSYYKAPDKLIKCQSNTTGSPLDCVNAVFGPPEKEKDAKVFAVARYGGPKQGFAIEFKGAYDAKDDDWGLEVPIYLVRDAKDKLTGGFRFVYDSDDGSGKEDWKVGLFISQPFDLSKLGI